MKRQPTVASVCRKVDACLSKHARDRMGRDIDHFMQSIQLSPQNTCSSYRRDLNFLLDYCKANGIRRWRDVDSGIIRDFIIYRRRDNIGGRTIARSLSVIRRFYKFLARNGLAKSDPTTGLHAPRHAKRLPAVLDVEQCNQLLDFHCHTSLDVRDKAMFELMYSSGLRVAEVVKLNVEDLDLADQMLRVVRGKGGYDRDVPFGRKARDAIKQWLKTRAKIVREGEKALFVGFRYGGRRITPRAVQKRLLYWSVKRLGSRVYPHILHHSCATHFLQGCGDLRATQELLGHADVSTTQIYTHLDLSYITKSLETARPNLNRQDNAQSVQVERNQSRRTRKARITLTDETVASLPLPDFGFTYHWDTDLKGFGVRVHYNGTRAYIVSVIRNGQRKVRTLGHPGELSADEARALAQTELKHTNPPNGGQTEETA